MRFFGGLIVSQNQNKSLCVKNISRARKPKKPRFRAGKRKRKNDKSVRAQGTSCLFVTHPNEKSFSIDLWESHTHPPLSLPKADCLQAKMEGEKVDREGVREKREKKRVLSVLRVLFLVAMAVLVIIRVVIVVALLVAISIALLVLVVVVPALGLGRRL